MSIIGSLDFRVRGIIDEVVCRDLANEIWLYTGERQRVSPPFEKYREDLRQVSCFREFMGWWRAVTKDIDIYFYTFYSWNERRILIRSRRGGCNEEFDPEETIKIYSRYDIGHFSPFRLWFDLDQLSLNKRGWERYMLDAWKMYVIELRRNILNRSPKKSDIIF